MNDKVYERITARLDYYASKEMKNKVVRTVIDAGAKKLAQEYEDIDTDYGAVFVQKGVISDDEGYIEARHPELAFIEYGTGYPGKESGYPSAYLPKDPIYFEDPTTGQQLVTMGWEYYYPNIHTKRTSKTGEKGWFHYGWEVGQPAGKQFYTTSSYLKDNLASIVSKGIKKGR